MLISQIRDFMIVIYSYLNWDFKRLLAAVSPQKPFEGNSHRREERINVVVIGWTLTTAGWEYGREIISIKYLFARALERNILIRFNKWIGEIYRISMLISVMLFLCFKALCMWIDRNRLGRANFLNKHFEPKKKYCRCPAKANQNSLKVHWEFKKYLLGFLKWFSLDKKLFHNTWRMSMNLKENLIS